MGDEEALTPREVMEREKARLLQQAAVIDRDMAEYERIAKKYGLPSGAQHSKPAPEGS